MGTQEVALRCTKIIIWTDLVLSLVNQTRARALDQLWGKLLEASAAWTVCTQMQATATKPGWNES